MDKNGMFGSLLETGKNTVSDTAKTTVSDVSDSVQSQLGIQTEPSAFSPNSQPAAADTERTKEMVNEYYGVSDTGYRQQLQADIDVQEQLRKDREELKRLMDRHNTSYYEPLVNPPKEKPQERAAERVERQVQEDRWELQKKEEKKPPPVADLRRKMAHVELRSSAG
jgi:hypothetical protein